MKRAWLAAVVVACCASTPIMVQASGDAGWRARFDALLLAPQISGQGFGRIFPPDVANVYFDGSLDDSLEGGVRFVLAKENCTGLGVQFRYFDFDNQVGYQGEWENGVNLLFDGEIGIDVHAVDIELTQRVTFRFWDLMVTGGLRQASVDIGQGGTLFNGVGSFYGLPSGVDFDGVGPTVSLNAERPLGGSGLSVVGRARLALLYGDTEQAFTFGNGAQPIRTNDDFVQVTEVQFGLNYEHRMRGATGSFGVFWEAQRWDSDSELLGNLGFHGLSLQTGVAY